MIALFAKNVKAEDLPLIQKLIYKIEANGFKIKFYEPLFRQIEKNIIINKSANRFNLSDDLALQNVKFLFSLGGDGTLLSASSLLFNSKKISTIPILGINFGRLGFLTSVGKNELDNLIDDIKQGNYSEELHSLIQWNEHFALNEVVLRCEKAGEMLDINVYIDDKYLTTYTSDGVIVATPTGSTAYSLSCGGAILSPDAKCFCITPICPHNLTFRPLVIPDTHKITLEVKRSRSNVSIYFDSRSFAINQTERVTLIKAKKEISLIRLHNQSFFSAIGNKLMWGKNLLV
ncbi:MAG: NAD(+)/NADH kinase [Bacteroidales bacterium]|jgi:NAD+ kinase|nr:NAD(+)/NADH kinase [Bacteroidales bacterium]